MLCLTAPARVSRGRFPNTCRMFFGRFPGLPLFENKTKNVPGNVTVGLKYVFGLGRLSQLFEKWYVEISKHAKVFAIAGSSSCLCRVKGPELKGHKKDAFKAAKAVVQDLCT